VYVEAVPNVGTQGRLIKIHVIYILIFVVKLEKCALVKTSTIFVETTVHYG